VTISDLDRRTKLCTEDWLRHRGVPERFVGATPNLFDAMQMREILPLVEQLDLNGVFISGAVGTGKTFVAATLFLEWARRGLADEVWKQAYVVRGDPMRRRFCASARFINVPDMLIKVRGDFSRKTKSNPEPEVVRHLSRMGLLVLDDLGAEQGTDWAFSFLYSVVNNRYNAEKPTIITSNLTLPELMKVDQRLGSRMASYVPVKLEGKDRRLDERLNRER